jgi:hypothetical protein
VADPEAEGRLAGDAEADLTVIASSRQKLALADFALSEAIQQATRNWIASSLRSSQ